MRVASSEFRWHLRDTTRDAHARLEHKLDVAGCWSSRESYSALLIDFLSLYRPLERVLAAIIQPSCGLDFAPRRKARLLAADLIDLGHTPAQLAHVPDYTDLPRIASLPEALGTMYVLEGSTLGGQVIFGRIAPALGISKMRGGQFFNAYGCNTAQMWAVFVSVLNRFGSDPDSAPVIVASARAAFAAFEACVGSKHRCAAWA